MDIWKGHPTPQGDRPRRYQGITIDWDYLENPMIYNKRSVCLVEQEAEFKKLPVIGIMLQDK